MNDLAKRPDVVQTGCKAIDGGWEAVGSVKNSTDAARSYDITIFFTTEQATVLDYATTTVQVDPGQSADWTASKKFQAADAMNCVLRGVG